MKPSINEHGVAPEEGADADQTVISRRRLLKAITATGGAVVASQAFPTQWVKPVVEAGVLPAHAQASPVTTVSNIQKTFTGTNDCQTNNLTGSSSNLSFDYNDPTGNMTNGAVVLFSTDFQTNVPAEIDLFNLAGVTVTGDAFQGTISIALCTRFGSNSTVTNQVQLRNTQGGVSNIASVTVPRPLGAAGADEVGSESLQ